MKLSLNLLTLLAISSTLGLTLEAKTPKPGKLFVPRAGKHDPAELFKKLDTDSDQSLSLDEFKASPIGKKNPDKAGKIFAKKDTDSDGKLSVEEFAAAKKEGKKSGKKAGKKAV